MNAINIAEIETLEQLQIDDETSENDAVKSIRFLGTFNQCVYGMVSFIGRIPWELHPDEEYLQVIEGNVEIIVSRLEDRKNVSLSAGDIFVVPKETWHQQFSSDGVKLMFITSSQGN